MNTSKEIEVKITTSDDITYRATAACKYTRMNTNQIRLEVTGTLYNGKTITVTTDAFPCTQDAFARAQGNGLLAAASKGAFRKIEMKEVEA